MSLPARAWWALVPPLFLLAAGAMVLLAPPYENPDELRHFSNAVYWAAKLKRDHVLAHHARLAAHQEKFQTPLYYLSLAPAVWLAGYEGPLRFPPIDPAFRCAPAPPGQTIHRRYLPLQGPQQEAGARAMYAMRLTSLLWGLFAVLLGQALFWKLSRRNRPLTLAATSLWALNPRWLETCASVSNDVAATALAALALWVLARTLRQARPPTLATAALLGALCALAAYAKMNAAGLAGVAAVAVFLGARFGGAPWRRCLGLALMLVATTLALLSPWLLRNYLMFGDALLLDRALWEPYVATRATTMHPWDFFREEFQGFRWSYYAVFGQFALLMHPAAYRVLDAFLLFGGALGLLFWARVVLAAPDWRERLVQSLAPAWLLLAFAAFLTYNSGVYALQGRLIFPAAWAIAYLQAGGLLQLAPKRWQGRAACLLLVIMLAWDYYVLRHVLWQAFRYLPI
ncbi:MAG: hypothetical protein KJ720_04505 [Proteobacteria bacterium]|nr:hypothetical protein [Pseudomonadota bacterium]MBU2467512.1 hypothetical protein [Pseudomonadota bacterium]MBU2517917.1 hypothetical protein [Pseudomonadota bacterium]